jgi:hypothetical protein
MVKEIEEYKAKLEAPEEELGHYKREKNQHP